MAGLFDFLQAASNTAASNVSGPVDAFSWLLNKAGVPVQEPILGSEWLKRRGLMKDVPQSAASLGGETFGLLAPLGIAAKAPQIAAQALKAQEAAKPMIANAAEGYMARQGLLQPATVWHGSPHKFDKFSASSIGSGEGAQAYGHGLYFADAKDVAMTYQPRDPKLEQRIMQRYSAAERTQQYPAMQVYEDFLLHKTPDEVASNIANAGYSAADEKLAKQALAIATKEYHNQRAGALYKVDLPDEAIARMLDWDKPLSEQAPEVRKILETEAARIAAQKSVAARASFNAKLAAKGLPPRFTDVATPVADISGWTGQQFHSALENILGGKIGVPEYLRAQGIPGIRYLDGNSRGAGQGTSNYVVFDDSLLKILERNGVPIEPGLLK